MFHFHFVELGLGLVLHGNAFKLLISASCQSASEIDIMVSQFSLCLLLLTFGGSCCRHLQG